VREAVEALVARGHAMAVASNKPVRFSRMILESKGIARHFLGIGGPDAETPAKPDPAMLVDLMARVGAAPAQTVVVGGMEVGFVLPGPGWGRRAVRDAMGTEAVGHRGKAFSDLSARIPPRLATVFRTGGFVFTTTSAGTGLWEAALLNLVPERVLAVVSGAFS